MPITGHEMWCDDWPDRSRNGAGALGLASSEGLLNAATGIALGLGVGLGVWALIFALVWMAVR